MGINVTLTGRLGGDPEAKEVGGNTVVEFSLASEEDRRRDQSHWFKVSVWGGLAKVTEYLKKGDFAIVIGSLSINESNGKTYYNVTADKIYLGPKVDRQPGSESSGRNNNSGGGGWGQKSKPAPEQPAAKTWGQPAPKAAEPQAGGWKGGAPTGGNGSGWGQNGGGGSSAGGGGDAGDTDDPIPF